MTGLPIWTKKLWWRWTFARLRYESHGPGWLLMRSPKTWGGEVSWYIDWSVSLGHPAWGIVYRVPDREFIVHLGGRNFCVIRHRKPPIGDMP